MDWWPLLGSHSRRIMRTGQHDHIIEISLPDLEQERSCCFCKLVPIINVNQCTNEILLGAFAKGMPLYSKRLYSRDKHSSCPRPLESGANLSHRTSSPYVHPVVCPRPTAFLSPRSP